MLEALKYPMFANRLFQMQAKSFTLSPALMYRDYSRHIDAGTIGRPLAVVVTNKIVKQKTKSTSMKKRNRKLFEKPNPTLVTDDMILLLTAKNAALVCGISQRTWRTWDALGYTPQPVYVGRAMFWRYKELEQWIDAGCPKREVWHYREKIAK